jgi:hypothetical protein
MINYLTKNKLLWKNTLCSENFKIYQVFKCYQKFCYSIENDNFTENDIFDLSRKKYEYDEFFNNFYLNQYMNKNIVLHNYLIENNLLNQYQLDLLSRTNDFIIKDVKDFLEEIDFEKDDMFIHDHLEILQFYKYVLYPMINENIVNDKELIKKLNEIDN